MLILCKSQHTVLCVDMFSVGYVQFPVQYLFLCVYGYVQCWLYAVPSAIPFLICLMSILYSSFSLAGRPAGGGCQSNKKLFHWIQNIVTSKYMTSQYSHFNTEYKIKKTVSAWDTIFKMQSVTQNTVTSKYMTSEHVKRENSDLKNKRFRNTATSQYTTTKYIISESEWRRGHLDFSGYCSIRIDD